MLPASATRNVVLLFDERPELPGLAALDAEFVRTINEKTIDQLRSIAKRRIARALATLTRRFSAISCAPSMPTRKSTPWWRFSARRSIFCWTMELRFFPAPPLFSAGSTKLNWATAPFHRHARGVLLKREFSPTLELALSLHPQARQVIVVGGTSDFDALLLEAMLRKTAHEASARWQARASADRMATRSGPPFETRDCVASSG